MNNFNSQNIGKKETKQDLINKICDLGGNNPDSPEIKALFAAKTKKQLLNMLSSYEKSIREISSNSDFSQDL